MQLHTEVQSTNPNQCLQIAFKMMQQMQEVQQKNIGGYAELGGGAAAAAAYA